MIDCLVFYTIFNSISVHLSMLSWSSFYQYSAQYSFQATCWLPISPLLKQFCYSDYHQIVEAGDLTRNLLLEILLEKKKILVTNNFLFSPNFFVEPTCGERDIVVTMRVLCMCLCACLCACMHPSVWICPDHNLYYCGWIQNDLTQLFSITCRCAIWNIHSGRLKVKVTLEGQIFLRTITPTTFDAFLFKFAW